MTFDLRELIEFARRQREQKSDDKCWVNHDEAKTLLATGAKIADRRPEKHHLELELEGLHFIHVCSNMCPEPLQIPKTNTA